MFLDRFSKNSYPFSVLIRFGYDVLLNDSINFCKINVLPRMKEDSLPVIQEIVTQYVDR